MNNYHVRLENGKAFMCCGKAGCPNVEFIEDEDKNPLVKINDDHGGSVKMLFSEASLISQAVNELSNQEKSKEVDADARYGTPGNTVAKYEHPSIEGANHPSEDA